MIESPDPPAAAHFPKRLLLMTVGRTPQVVTETIYALVTRSGSEAFVPTEVHLVTTEEGRRQAELDLLDSGQARLSELCIELGVARGAMHFDASTIHVVRDEDQRPLEDIRTVADNQQGADAIVDLVRRFTAEPGTALHVSLAGGRKTMGFYLGYALSLFGRPQDRLSHVLVDPRFENLPDFFFPTREPRILRLRDGRGTVDARDAQVELADIPVVSLRGLLGPELLGDSTARYAEIVRRARAQLEGVPGLHFDLRTLTLRINDRPTHMRMAERVWYAYLVARAARGQPGFGWRNCDTRGVVKDLRSFVHRLDIERHGADPMLCESWSHGDELDTSAADRLTTRCNTQLRRALGPGPAAAYRIRREGRRGASTYRVTLSPAAIHLIEPGA